MHRRQITPGAQKPVPFCPVLNVLQKNLSGGKRPTGKSPSPKILFRPNHSPWRHLLPNLCQIGQIVGGRLQKRQIGRGNQNHFWGAWEEPGRDRQEDWLPNLPKQGQWQYFAD